MIPSRGPSRGKSRSLAPLQGSFQPPVQASRRPEFLPPSHYAAAAGVPYNGKNTEPIGETTEPSPRPVIYMPVSYPTDSGSEVESPLATKIRPALLNKRSSTSLSGKKPARRKSQMGLIEDLESQLLPSLNDTIGRMTQSSQTPPQPFELPPTPVTTARPPLPISSTRAPMSSTPRQAATPSSTPRMQSNASLKSALRTPGSPATPTTLDVVTPKALRRAKSFVGESGIPRKMGTSSESDDSRTPRVSKKLAPATTPQLVTTPIRHRSSTAPGMAQSPGAPPLSPLPRTPDYAITKRKTDSPLIQARAQSVLSTPNVFLCAKSQAHEEDSSASEVEYEADALHRHRSRLFVANAQVMPSSSSEGDPKPRQRGASPNPRSRLPTLTAKANRSKTTVGLGIAVDQSNRSAPTEETSTESNILEPFQEQSVASDHIDNKKEGRRSAVCHDNKLVSRPQEVTDQENMPIHESSQQQKKQQRRETLQGLIDVLESSRMSNMPSLPSEESDAYPSAGFLVHDDIVSDASTRPIAPQRGDNFSDDESTYSSDDGQDHATNNHATPTFPSSPAPARNAGALTPQEHIHRDGKVTQHGLSAPRRQRAFSVIAPRCHPQMPSVDFQAPVPENRRLPEPSVNQQGKSSGHSSIVRHSVAVSIPSALRRYSVYGEAPALLSRSVNASQKQDVQQIRGLKDISAFSDNDQVEMLKAPDTKATISLPHADSDLSSMYSSNSERWNEGDDSFSSGAASLFRQFSGSRSSRMTRESSSTVFSATSSLASIYKDEDPADHTATKRHEVHDTVVDSMPTPTLPAKPSHVPSALIDTQSDRRALLEMLFQNEDAFLNRMHAVVNLFIKPLRVRDSKAWVAGVPTDLGRLFDWLEDIAVLHSQIRSALDVIQNHRNSGPLHIGQVLREFVPRLEVYQPYLVRQQASIASLTVLVEHSSSDLGEFIRVQESAEECHGWSIEQLLHEPVRYLNDYPKMFSRLLSLTPRDHPDYISTFSLLHSTNTIIRVMNEVKEREEEYDFVKDTASKIDDFPASTQLARRDRRLLAHGDLWRVVRSTQIHGMPQQDNDSMEGLAYDQPPTHTTPKSVRFNFDVSTGASERLQDGSPLRVIVFTDLVLLVSPIKQVTQTNLRWSFGESGGVFRIVSHVTNETSRDVVSLNLLAIGADNIDAGLMTEQSMVTNVELRYPSDMDAATRECWESAWKRCSNHTRRSLSFPSQSGRYLALGAGVDLEADTKSSVLALLAAGLPLPKSPSIQIEEASTGSTTHGSQLEREERGWWALRFQQVLKEMQRREEWFGL